MTVTARTESRPAPLSADAALWGAGGATWLIAGLVAGGSLEPIWIVADLLLLAAMVRLWMRGPGSPWRPTRAATVGLGLALAARVAFLAAELVAVVTGDDENVLLPLGAVGTAIGLVVLGAVIARRGQGSGPGMTRLAPLVAGVYPFVVMFPVVAATGEPSVVAIAFWGVPMMLVGWALAFERLAR